eukprot:TRINITY_DN2185_c0_g1_i2.p1 TRINITY_DN2185_c0_g1~~TRINITY_DN2185_c0_g1_i2.p1  ORF type:complete len:299 (+),score=37.58 TRINITY_DN2185_c0_g1_i2:128-1024(+)
MFLVLLLTLLCASLTLALPSAILPKGTTCSDPQTNESVVPLSTVLKLESQLMGVIDKLNATIQTLQRKELPGKSPNSTYNNCNEIIAACSADRVSCPSGEYYVHPTSVPSAILAYCDMEEDGGGWTTLMNYYTRAEEDALNVYHTNSLPLYRPHFLGFEGSQVADEWGQASNALTSGFDFTEIRFFCEGQYDYEHLDFSTTAGVSYLKTGMGNFGTDFPDKKYYSGHYRSSTLLPAAINRGYTNTGDKAMSIFPFYMDGSDTPHYVVGQNQAETHFYYACNSHHANGGEHFHHMVFVR